MVQNRPLEATRRTNLQYLLLTYTNESTDPQPGSPEFARRTGDYAVYTQALAASGKFAGGNALQPIPTAKTVRVRNGES